MTHDVFICYSSQDSDLAMLICAELEKAGLSCWVAPRNVTGGKSFAREIIQAIETAQVCVFIFTAHSNISEHVENEINTAFNAKKTIIPFKIDQFEINKVLQYYLNKRHWIESSGDLPESIQRLIESVTANIPEKAKETNINNALSLLEKEISSGGVSKAAIERLLARFEAVAAIGGGGDMQQGKYEMFLNAAGEILIVTNYAASEPENPRLVYDGGDTALLYRNRTSAFNLSNIAPGARTDLSKVSKVLIAEIEDDDTAREYHVPILHVRSLKALMDSTEEVVPAPPKKFRPS